VPYMYAGRGKPLTLLTFPNYYTFSPQSPFLISIQEDKKEGEGGREGDKEMKR